MFHHHGRMHTYEAYRPGCANSHDEATCNECVYRGTSDIVYRENDGKILARRAEDGDADAVMEEDEQDEQFLADASSQYDSLLDGILHQKAMDEDMDIEEDETDSTDDDREDEYCVHRKCDGVRDIALVGEVSTPSHPITISHLISILTDRLQARASVEPLPVLRPCARMGRTRRPRALSR